MRFRNSVEYPSVEPAHVFLTRHRCKYPRKLRLKEIGLCKAGEQGKGVLGVNCSQIVREIVETVGFSESAIWKVLPDELRFV